MEERDALQTFFLTRTLAFFFRELHNACKTSLKVEREYRFERIKLYNTVLMLENKNFWSFYARFSAQIVLCNWPNVQEKETSKNLFIGRVRDVDVQQQLIKAKTDLDNTLKLALEFDKCASTSAQFQKLFPHNQHSLASKVKPEPTFSIQSSRGKLSLPQNQNNRQNTQNNQGNKSCYFCVNPFSPYHRKSCPAWEVTCNLCKKCGHFAKCCNSSKRRVNLVQENEEASCSSIDCNFIDAEYDREPKSKYGVLQLESAVRINSIEVLKSNRGKPRSLSFQLRSG